MYYSVVKHERAAAGPCLEVLRKKDLVAHDEFSKSENIWIHQNDSVNSSPFRV
jgi:hypothetical protein